jgi:hypothetical protein
MGLQVYMAFKKFRHAAPGGHREFLRSLEEKDLITARFKRNRLLAECGL